MRFPRKALQPEPQSILVASVDQRGRVAVHTRNSRKLQKRIRARDVIFEVLKSGRP